MTTPNNCSALRCSFVWALGRHPIQAAICCTEDQGSASHDEADPVSFSSRMTAATGQEKKKQPGSIREGTWVQQDLVEALSSSENSSLLWVCITLCTLETDRMLASAKSRSCDQIRERVSMFSSSSHEPACPTSHDKL